MKRFRICVNEHDSDDPRDVGEIEIFSVVSEDMPNLFSLVGAVEPQVERVPFGVKKAALLVIDEAFTEVHSGRYPEPTSIAAALGRLKSILTR